MTSEIIVRWMGWPSHKEKIEISEGHKPYKEFIKYPMNYETLHEAWVKFRDLRVAHEIADEHFHWCHRIHTAMGYKLITEAFDELVKGIEWYNSLNK